jgi:hypothetical protein
MELGWGQDIYIIEVVWAIGVNMVNSFLLSIFDTIFLFYLIKWTGYII